MNEFAEVEYQIPWYFIFWASLISCGIVSAFLKRILAMTRQRYLVANLVVVICIFCASALFSYGKLSTIQNRIQNGKLHELEGNVDELEKYNGKDKFVVGEEFFEINYHDLYCLSGEGLVSESDYVFLKYVDLGRWAGFIDGRCVLDLKVRKKRVGDS